MKAFRRLQKGRIFILIRILELSTNVHKNEAVVLAHMRRMPTNENLCN